MYKSLSSPHHWFEFGCGWHEKTLLSVEFGPELTKRYASVSLGLSLLYLNIFFFEWTVFFKPR